MRLPYAGTHRKTQDFNDDCCRASYTRFGIVGHNGWDIAMPVWTPIYAPHAGKILEAASDPSGYGNYVKVESSVEGSILAHLAKISVGVGEQVQEGNLVGYSGNSGNSTGPHLHWGYYRHPRKRVNGFNGFIDQEYWLNLVLPAAPAAEPLTITDQTKIPLGMPWGDLELAAVRSTLNDLSRDLKECRATPPVTPPEPPKTDEPTKPSDPPGSSLLVGLLQWVLSKLGR